MPVQSGWVSGPAVTAGVGDEAAQNLPAHGMKWGVWCTEFKGSRSYVIKDSKPQLALKLLPEGKKNGPQTNIFQLTSIPFHTFWG